MTDSQGKIAVLMVCMGNMPRVPETPMNTGQNARWYKMGHIAGTNQARTSIHSAPRTSV